MQTVYRVVMEPWLFGKNELKSVSWKGCNLYTLGGGGNSSPFPPPSIIRALEVLNYTQKELVWSTRYTMTEKILYHVQEEHTYMYL